MSLYNDIKDLSEGYFSDTVILNEEEISDFNMNTKKRSNSLYDIFNVESVSKKTIYRMINSYELSTKHMYDGVSEIGKNTMREITENRNIEAIKDLKGIKKALVIKRTNLRTFPIDIPFYDSLSSEYDRLQETSLPLNTPIIILHTSRDKKWFFVISKIYYGWVKKDDVSFAKDEDWAYFSNPINFVVITEPEIEADGRLLEMGSTFPYDLNNNKIEIIIPITGEDGYVSKKKIVLNDDMFSIGFIPYTRKNVMNQAFKYLDFPYSWGGKNRSVDCSSFTSNVYKTFGFIFPRNASEQERSLAKKIDVEDLRESEKIEYLKNFNPSLLYEHGHVLIYIGSKDDGVYAIHASGSSGKVSIIDLLKCRERLEKMRTIIKIC